MTTLKDTKGHFYKKTFFLSVQKREVPYSPNNSGIPLLFPLWTFPATSGAALKFLKRSISRRKDAIASEPTASSYRAVVLLLLLLLPRDGDVDNNHTNWKRWTNGEGMTVNFFSSMVFIIHEAEWKPLWRWTRTTEGFIMCCNISATRLTW
jgi:hypothetical protein